MIDDAVGKAQRHRGLAGPAQLDGVGVTLDGGCMIDGV